MKIGLIDVDSHNFPNLCLMKLSAYHKAKGHTVEWWNAKGRYDLVYKSRVFTDTYEMAYVTVPKDLTKIKSTYPAGVRRAFQSKRYAFTGLYH